MGGVITDSTDTVNYKAYLTGRSYEHEDLPIMDSIRFHINHRYYQTNTTTIIDKPVVYKQKLITTSPSITAGYDPINKQWGVMVGVSLNFNIWK